MENWAELHDNVPDRPSTKGVPVGYKLATMALKIKTVVIPKGGLHGKSCHPVWDVSASIWAELHETSVLSATLAVYIYIYIYIYIWIYIGWDVVMQPGPVLQSRQWCPSDAYGLRESEVK